MNCATLDKCLSKNKKNKKIHECCLVDKLTHEPLLFKLVLFLFMDSFESQFTVELSFTICIGAPEWVSLFNITGVHRSKTHFIAVQVSLILLDITGVHRSKTHFMAVQVSLIV